MQEIDELLSPQNQDWTPAASLLDSVMQDIQCCPKNSGFAHVHNLTQERKIKELFDIFINAWFRTAGDEGHEAMESASEEDDPPIDPDHGVLVPKDTDMALYILL